MAGKPQNEPRTTMVPVTTMEEIPLLDDAERAQLMRELEQAQDEIRDGKGIEFDPEAFKARLLRIVRDKST